MNDNIKYQNLLIEQIEIFSIKKLIKTIVWKISPKFFDKFSKKKFDFYFN